MIHRNPKVKARNKCQRLLVSPLISFLNPFSSFPNESHFLLNGHFLAWGKDCKMTEFALSLWVIRLLSLVLKCLRTCSRARRARLGESRGWKDTIYRKENTVCSSSFRTDRQLWRVFRVTPGSDVPNCQARSHGSEEAGSARGATLPFSSSGRALGREGENDVGERNGKNTSHL